MGKRRVNPPTHRCLQCNKSVAESDWGQAMRCPLCAKELVRETRDEIYRESLRARFGPILYV